MKTINFKFIILMITAFQTVSNLNLSEFCFASDLNCTGKYNENGFYKTECKKACPGMYSCTEGLCTSDLQTCNFYKMDFK